MSPQATLRTALDTLGLTGRGLARVLAQLAGTKPSYRTVERWTTDREPPAAAMALVRVLLDAEAGAAALAQERVQQEARAEQLQEHGRAMTARRMGRQS